MRCPYCQGKRYRPNPEDPEVALPCLDCAQTGRVCHLCGRPDRGDDRCECPSGEPIVGRKFKEYP